MLNKNRCKILYINKIIIYINVIIILNKFILRNLVSVKKFKDEIPKTVTQIQNYI